MSFFSIRNDALGTENDCSRIPTEGGRRLCEWGNKSFPGSTVTEVTQEEIEATISDNDTIRLINRRSPYRLKKAKTLAVGEANFTSFAGLSQFFEQAVRRGAAVCQILKKCSEADIDSFVTAVTSKQYSLDQLRDILYDAKIEERSWPNAIEPNKVKRLGEDIKNKVREEGFYVPIGTGFLVGRNHLLTNNHVLSHPDDADDFIARFRYDRNVDLKAGNLDILPVDYQLNAKCFAFSPPEELDYTLIEVVPLAPERAPEHKEGSRQPKLSFLSAGDNFGWLPLFENDDLISPPCSKETLLKNPRLRDQLSEDLRETADLFGLSGEPVNIIQHPRGRAKEIVFHSNRVQRILQKDIQYEADTDFGSSGSPVFNRQWQTVALHRAVLVEQKEDDISVQGSLGVRTCEIVKHMKTHRHPDDAQTFVDEFVDEFVIPEKGLTNASTDRRGTIYILAGISNKDSNEEKYGTFETLSERFQAIAKTIQASKELSDFGYAVELIPYDSTQSDGEIMHDWLEPVSRFNFGVGDVALFITMDAYYVSEPNSDVVRVIENDSLRGVGVYYAGNRLERQAQAQLLLQAILTHPIDQTSQYRSKQQTAAIEPSRRKTISLVLPNRGVRSDLTFIQEPVEPIGGNPIAYSNYYKSLPFTRSLGIPSLILRLGFVTNPEDRAQVTRYQAAISEGIVKGLLAWADSINPVSSEAYRLNQADDTIVNRSTPDNTRSQIQQNIVEPQDTLYRLLL